MSHPIDQFPWICPECCSSLEGAETEEIQKRLHSGESQIEMSCNFCNEQITADTSDEDTIKGNVELNQKWVYE